MNSMNFSPLLAEGSSDAVENLLHWLCGLVGIPVQVGVPLILILATLGTILGACSYAIWLERKLSAWIQDRKGPNRVGWAGLLQPIADGAKFLLKEDIIPDHVDKVMYVIAPTISVLTTLLAFAVVPFGPTDYVIEFWGLRWLRFIVAPGVDIGIVFIFAVTSLAVYGIILGGWASNNKYSTLGALRASAQVVSYEIPLGMSVLGIALVTGSLNLEDVMHKQADGGLFGWNIWYQPMACLIFFTAALAESNRIPFDLPECEQELVGGYHTEYSALKFALFFLGEYTHVVTISFLTTILFLGGWQFPLIAEPDSLYTGVWLVKMGVLMSKVLGVVLVIMVIRWTIPRFRFDQLMGLAWKVLIPLSMANVVAVMTIKQFGWSLWWLLPISVAMFGAAGAISVAAKQAELNRKVEPVVS